MSESNETEPTVEQLKEKMLREHAELIESIRDSNTVTVQEAEEILRRQMHDVADPVAPDAPNPWENESAVRQEMEHPTPPEDPLAILPTDSESEIESKIRKRWGLKPV